MTVKEQPRRTWRRPGRLAVLLLVIGLVSAAVAATSSGALTRGKSSKPTIVLADNSWEGSTANDVVAQYVIQKYLGYKVNLLTIDEIPAWPAMTQGKVSAVLEVWGHSPLYSKYVQGSHQVVNAGLEGPNGNIGWYVPTYLMQQHPELKTWQGVKKDWKLFVTPQSSPQGQFLDGSPSYVTNDQALVKNLGINLKVVFAGTEAAQLTEIETDYKAKKPVLFYWYTPQYLNVQYKLDEVKLPARFKGCQDDAKAGGNIAQYKCAYDNTVIEKVFSKKFAQNGGAAYSALKKFKLTNEDQEIVAKWIAGDHMNPDKAGQKWIAQNSAKVKAWFGK